VYLSDATARLTIGYYSDFSNCLPSHVRMAEQFETLAISRATELVYPSSWAAESAIRDYGADPSKVHVIPFGANMQTAPAAEKSSNRAVKSSCELLFVGVDWERKGGDIAIETVQALQSLGVAAKLTVIGCRPRGGHPYANVEFIPFINKNSAEGRARLERLYTEADFFLLPTRAECFGIALCEANAYGLPVLTTRTGGVEEIVREGKNGFLFSLDSGGDRYAARICEVLQDPEGYRKLRASSRSEYETRLNWDAWGTKMSDVLRSSCARKAANSALPGTI
jgi:glycosyltransferase involved in cell wall biosynthesis